MRFVRMAPVVLAWVWACSETTVLVRAPRRPVFETGHARAPARLPATGVDAAARRVLDVAPRAQAPESPPEGWCGEAAIQEGLLYLGAYVSQSAIHRAGKPVHPDLYSNEIPVALAALGARHSRFPGGGYRAFVGWASEALDRGFPVLAGVKLLPTQHPEWGLDHFVLVVGEGEPGLLVDTTWGTRIWSNDASRRGISFVNAGYGLRLEGLAGGGLPARVVVLREDASRVALRATCAGAGMALERRAGPFDTEPVDVVDATERRLDLGRDEAAYFRCVALPVRSESLR
jgi:hypothetical protein